MKKKLLILIVLSLLSVSVRAEDKFEDPLNVRLERGEIITNGGFVERAVWSKMMAVIDVPPEIVWKLFLRTNDWKSYKMPTLSDSRAVTQEIIEKVGTSQKVDDFYKALGTNVFDPFEPRKKGSVWSGYFFQYFDLPWPVSNRWMIVKSKYDETKIATGSYECDWEKEIGNIRSAEGHFALSPFLGDKKRTLFVYNVKADSGAHIPKFLLRWGVNSTMPGIVKAIRQAAVKEYKMPPPVLQTQ